MARSKNTIEKRTRKGCNACKFRRVKCDGMFGLGFLLKIRQLLTIRIEKKPSCSACLRLKHECSYDLHLKWEDEMFTRGLAFGRSRINRKNFGRNNSLEIKENGVNFNELSILPKKVPLKKKYIFLNTTINDIKSVYEISGKQLALNNKAASINCFESDAFDTPDDVQNCQVLSTDIHFIKQHDSIWDSYNGSDFEHYLSSFTNHLCDYATYFPLGNNLSFFPFGYNTSDYNLFQYFVKNICPVCICNSKKETYSDAIPLMKFNSDMMNPYLKFIVPLGMKSELLFKTVVAISANELNIVHGHRFFEDIAHSFISYVLKELPKEISVRKTTRSNTWDEILATILMLCFADISSNCGRMWISYLNEAKEFIRYFIDSQVEGELSKFVLRYFISHEIMGQTAWSDQQSNFWRDSLFENLKYDYDTNIDLVLGCCPFLLTLVNNITLLGDYVETLDFRLKHTKDTIRESILRQRDQLEFELVHLEQKSFLEEDNESSLFVQLIAEVKKIAAILYLFLRVDQELYYALGKCYYKQYNLRLRSAKSWVLKAIDLMKKMDTSSMSLLWPLFIVGVVSYDDDDCRYFVLQRLEDMENSRSLANVRMAKLIIETLWKEKDLGCLSLTWKDMMGGRADTISLA